MEIHAKNCLGILALITAVLFLVAETYATQQFTITGELIPKGIVIRDATVIIPEHDTKRLNFDTAKVVISYEFTNARDETETVELTSGQFHKGFVTLSGEIEKTIDAKVVVDAGGKDPLTLDIVISPDVSISFVVIENIAQMKLLGVSRSVKNHSNKFTISGDLSSIDGDLEGAIVLIQSSEYDYTGERKKLNFGSVMLDEGKFSIEAEVQEPRIVNILIIGNLGHTQTKAVIEPNAEITLESQGSWIKGVFATSSNASRHARLIDVWQQSEAYLSTRKDYLEAYQQFQNHPESVNDDQTPLHRELVRKLNRVRYDFLQQVARNADDPINALLAMELNAFWGKEEAQSIYDRLSKSLDKDLVARRVTHARNDHASYLATIGIDKGLGIGKHVSKFTLPNLDGEDTNLEDLLEKSEYLLVDFWASWCGGCLATFPALKDLYTSYAEHGFEIVSISIDDIYELWADRSEEQELPWVNLGELKGFDGEIATSYGVTFIPKNYLIDSNGQIVDKDISTDKLEEFLVGKFSESWNSDESNLDDNDN
ncbi:MAG: AhpC/TSA family protein [Gammaproteobacteria bacterium]|nr:AhpC/TSA family protein [Gammaproteobacteria bacterium]MYF01676.1 AhpC/TSA family protein [Gammaproteobacteria bacterium]